MLVPWSLDGVVILWHLMEDGAFLLRIYAVASGEMRLLGLRR